MARIAAAVVLLLASAAPAFAECAWVVWSHATGPSNSGDPVDRYEIAGAYPTRNECLKIVRGYAQVMKEAGLTVSRGEYETGSVIGEKGDRSMQYFCIPDTVDPRGPKGK